MSSKSSKSVSIEREKENSPIKQERRDARQDPDSHKIFLTNLNGDHPEQQVEDEVRKLFEQYGEVKRLSLKKHKHGFYYFGFLEYPNGFEAYKAIKELDQHPLFGKNMKVRQDRQSQGCFYCKRKGHFARECPENRDRRRSYSNDRRSRERYDRRRDDRHDRYDRRDRDRDTRDRYDRNDRNDRNDRTDRTDRNDRGRDYDRDRNERDRNRNDRRRNRSRSYSDSKSSSESSRRRDRKEKKQRRRRSRS